MQGHIRKRTYTTKTGKQTVNWYVVVDLGRDANGKRKQKWHGGFKTRREAEVARTKIVGDLHDGTYNEPSKLTLREWVEDKWLPTVQTQVKPSTFESYQRNMAHHVLPTLGGRKLRDIGPAQLNELYATLLASGRRNGGGGLSAKTVRYIHTIVHKALADALDAGLVATNVAERAKPPKPRTQSATSIQFWTPEQLGAFFALVEGHRLATARRVSAMTGRAEAKWSACDGKISTSTTHASTCAKQSSASAMSSSTRRRRTTELESPASTSTPSKRYASNEKRNKPSETNWEFISERLGHENPAFTLKQHAHVIPGMQADAARTIALLVNTPSVRSDEHRS